MTITLHSLGYALVECAQAPWAPQHDSPGFMVSHPQTQLPRWQRQLDFVEVGSAVHFTRGSDSLLTSAHGATALMADNGGAKSSPNSDLSNAALLLKTPAVLAQTDAVLALGHRPKPVLIGPLTLLWSTGGLDAARLDSVVSIYSELLSELTHRGVQWVQLDEPLLQRAPGTEPLALPWRRVLARVYQRLFNAGPKLLLAIHGGGLGEMLRAVLELPVAGIHIDAQAAPAELACVVDWLPAHKVLSVGLACEQTALVEWQPKLLPIYRKLGERLWSAPVRGQPETVDSREDWVDALLQFRERLVRGERRPAINLRLGAGEVYQAVALAALNNP